MKVEDWIDTCKAKNQTGNTFTLVHRDIIITFDGDHTISARNMSADINKGNEIDSLYTNLGIYWNTTGRVA